MEKEILLIAVIGIILVIGIVQAIQLNVLSAKIVGALNVVSQAPSPSTGTVDTNQMTENEKMNYEMHGIIPARFGSDSASQSLPDMVGGC